jgi:hypothetical protein
MTCASATAGTSEAALGHCRMTRTEQQPIAGAGWLVGLVASVDTISEGLIGARPVSTISPRLGWIRVDWRALQWPRAETSNSLN